jgi:hypothetical protein
MVLAAYLFLFIVLFASLYVAYLIGCKRTEDRLSDIIDRESNLLVNRKLAKKAFNKHHKKD